MLPIACEYAPHVWLLYAHAMGIARSKPSGKRGRIRGINLPIWGLRETPCPNIARHKKASACNKQPIQEFPSGWLERGPGLGPPTSLFPRVALQGPAPGHITMKKVLRTPKTRHTLNTSRCRRCRPPSPTCGPSCPKPPPTRTLPLPSAPTKTPSCCCERLPLGTWRERASASHNREPSPRWLRL